MPIFYYILVNATRKYEVFLVCIVTLKKIFVMIFNLNWFVSKKNKQGLETFPWNAVEIKPVHFVHYFKEIVLDKCASGGQPGQAVTNTSHFRDSAIFYSLATQDCRRIFAYFVLICTGSKSVKCSWWAARKGIMNRELEIKRLKKICMIF